MCRLITVGSGSSGNTYLLRCGDEVLVLDCGMPFIETKKALNFNIRGIVGAVVTHVHGDHHAYAHEYEAAGIPVWKPYENTDKTTLQASNQMGKFTVQSFGVVHDVPCVGYLIKHPDIGKMIYVSDTEYIKYKFNDLNIILVEMNHSDEYIDRNAAKFAHTKKGHMEKQTTLDFIKANARHNLNHVVLCHLSPDGSNPVEFRDAVKAIVEPWVTVDVAVPGLIVNLDEVPF